MKEIQFSIEINASKEIVWTTLWDQLSIWLSKSIETQWDYKNITKRKGEHFRLK